MKHTPGPWASMYGCVYAADGESRIGLADRNNDQTTPTERDANVRLMAAAPEMLECLNAVVAYFGDDDLDNGLDEILTQARELVAKATGATASQPKRTEAEKLVDALRDAGLSPRSYSGRGMFGDECIGVSVDRMSELDGIPMKGMRTDSLGRGLIAYWPRLAWSDAYED